MRWDVGAKYIVNDIVYDYLVADWIGNEWINNLGFTNVFGYDQYVSGVYTTYSIEHKRVGVQGGLRYEHTRLETELQTTNQSNRQDYANFFPSAHVSYKLTDNLSTQFGYSRRISRPGLWDLNPFNSFRDNFNISVGNPNLQPEFTDALEWSVIQNWKKASLNTIAFYRHTTDVINDWVTVLDNVSYTSPRNIGETRDLGAEFSVKIQSN